MVGIQAQFVDHHKHKAGLFAFETILPVQSSFVWNAVPSAPVLVADAPEFHVVGFRMAIAAAHPPQLGVLMGVTVLNPAAGLLHRATAYIQTDVGLGIDHAAKAHKLVGAKLIRLRLLPPQVVASRPSIARANAVHPMVVISKTPAGPAQRWQSQLFQLFGRVHSDATHVLNFGISTDPDAAVDAATQVLGNRIQGFIRSAARCALTIESSAVPCPLVISSIA